MTAVKRFSKSFVRSHLTPECGHSKIPGVKRLRTNDFECGHSKICAHTIWAQITSFRHMGFSISGKYIFSPATLVNLQTRRVFSRGGVSKDMGWLPRTCVRACKDLRSRKFASLVFINRFRLATRTCSCRRWTWVNLWFLTDTYWTIKWLLPSPHW